MSTSKASQGVLALIMVSLLLAPTASTAQSNLTELNIGVLPYLDYQILYVADEMGFDSELGYEFSFTQFPLEPNETRALVRGDIDIAQGAIGSLVSQLPARPDLRVVVSGAQYKGFAFIIRKDSDIKTYSELFAELGDHQQALEAVVDQMIGRELLTTESSYRATIAGLAAEGGHAYDELKVQNFAEATQAATAFIRGTGDIYLGAVAQTERLINQMDGYEILIQNEEMGAPGLWYSNIYVTDAYLQENRRQLVELTAIWQRTVRYMNEHTDEAYAIILEHLNPQTAGAMTVEDLKNQIPRTTFFPTTEEAAELVFDESSPSSWRALVNYQFEQAEILGTDLSNVSADDFIAQDEIFAEFLADDALQAFVNAPF